MAYPALRGANQLINASGVLAALDALRQRIPVTAQAVRNGLAMVELPGRFQVLPGRPQVILDVAHNPHAAATLAQNLDNMGFFPFTYAIFGAMSDKDVLGVISHLKDKIDHWYLTGLPLDRAADTQYLADCLRQAGVQESTEKGAECTIRHFPNPQEAIIEAKRLATENDRIAVFGSFLTVAGVMALKTTD
jgi:dihydrofolate synthase/folylpolyglutamate synthase